MAGSDVTTRVDEATIQRIREMVERAQTQYRAEHPEWYRKRTPEQVRKTLAALDELAKHLPTRPQHEVEEEL